LVETYKILVPNDRSDSDFGKILDLKMIKGTERQELLDKYLNLGRPTSSSLTNSLPGLPSSIAASLSGNSSPTPILASSMNSSIGSAASSVEAKTKAFKKILLDVFDKQ